MRRPRLLDLCCGQGGASVGYYLAGFDVIGVDTKPQPQYPFPLLRRDVLAALRDDHLLSEIDAIHASPPCHSETTLRFVTKRTYVDLLTPTMEMLSDLVDIPWVVENVESTSKMRGSTILCGTHFGLGAAGRILRRHRRFLTSFPLLQPPACTCDGKPTGGVYGNLSSNGSMVRGFRFGPDDSRRAMGIDWMSRKGLCLAIPPDYARWVGEQMISRFWPGTPARDGQRDRYCSGRTERFARL